MRKYIFLIIFSIMVTGLMYVGLSKLDAEPPKIMMDKSRANTRYVTSKRWVTIHIRAIIRDDKAIKSISIGLWGTIKSNALKLTETLYYIEFSQPNTKIVLIDESVTAGTGSKFILPGWYYVRFVVEDFIGSERVMSVKIYLC